MIVHTTTKQKIDSELTAYWDEYVGGAELKISIAGTDPWKAEKHYSVNIHKENSKETEVKQKCQD